MSKRAVILFDLSGPPPDDHDYSDRLKEDDWAAESDVKIALEKLGCDVHLLAVFDDIPRLIRELRFLKPDFVFNLCEAFAGRRDFEPQIAGVLDLMGIPYTGTKSLGLAICQDKALSKKILAHHRIRVPKWITSSWQKPLKSFKNFSFPAFVKPIREESSEGISRDSYVENEKDCLGRVKFIHERYRMDALIEEFVGGREFYVSVLGGARPKVFAIRELTFREFPEDVPRFATFKTKWDAEYRKRWGIRNDFAKNLPEKVEREIQKTAKKGFQLLELSGYARFDMRMSESEEIVVLEANPNPSLDMEDDFSQSALRSGLKYDQMIEKIVSQAT